MTKFGNRTDETSEKDESSVEGLRGERREHVICNHSNGFTLTTLISWVIEKETPNYVRKIIHSEIVNVKKLSYI